MSYLTNQDVINIQTTAIRRTAQALSISIHEKSMLQLFDEISRTEDPLYDLLDSFVATYRQYQNYHFYLDNELINGPLSISQQDDLARYIQERDKTRNALINAIQQRGF